MRYSNIKKRNLVRTYPSRKSMEKFRARVKDLAKISKTHIKTMRELIEELNALIRGWTNYFNHTNASKQYNTLYRYTEWKVSKFYCGMHKIPRVSDDNKYISIGHKSCLIRMTGRISHP